MGLSEPSKRPRFPYGTLRGSPSPGPQAEREGRDGAAEKGGVGMFMFGPENIYSGG